MINRVFTVTNNLIPKAYNCTFIGYISQDYNSGLSTPNFHIELIPVHSPLLRMSFLVYHPLLTYMLKFS